MEYAASIKVYEPRRAGVLVELSGEFDVSCLEALGQALRRVASLQRPAFVDLSGITFMDLLCVRELLAAGSRSWPAEPLRLCRPSAQFRLSLTACAAEETAAVLPDDDPRCEALVTVARERRTAAARHSHPARRSEHQLYLREPAKGLEHEVPGRPGRGVRPSIPGRPAEETRAMPNLEMAPAHCKVLVASP